LIRLGKRRTEQEKVTGGGGGKSRRPATEENTTVESSRHQGEFPKTKSGRRQGGTLEHKKKIKRKGGNVHRRVNHPSSKVAGKKSASGEKKGLKRSKTGPGGQASGEYWDKKEIKPGRVQNRVQRGNRVKRRGLKRTRRLRGLVTRFEKKTGGKGARNCWGGRRTEAPGTRRGRCPRSFGFEKAEDHRPGQKAGWKKKSNQPRNLTGGRKHYDE